MLRTTIAGWILLFYLAGLSAATAFATRAWIVARPRISTPRWRGTAYAVGLLGLVLGLALFFVYAIYARLIGGFSNQPILELKLLRIGFWITVASLVCIGSGKGSRRGIAFTSGLGVALLWIGASMAT
jgi:hypothetical protein